MYITSSVSVLNYAVVPQYYQILPLTCILQSNDIDEELSSNCSNLLAMLAFTIVLEPYVPAALDAITEVANSPVWSARGVIAEFIPVFVFHNFATIISHEEWVLKVTLDLRFIHFLKLFVDSRHCIIIIRRCTT